MNTTFTEPAPAKLNLTLTILGRRADGYHELESLVAFARVGDTVALTRHWAPPGDQSAPRLAVSGPFAPALSPSDQPGANLVARALERVETALARPLPASFHLEKNLPVASGVGGGSADAAAALRLLARAFPDETAALDWTAVALSLGADVPVCLAGTSTWMGGIGDRLTPVALPSLDIVLVNAMAAVPADKTQQVFRELAAPPIDANRQPPASTSGIQTRADLIALIEARGNDLTEAARRVVPSIGDVVTALKSCHGCRVANLSGAGPTMIGVFDDATSAATARALLRSRHPTWWVEATSTA